MTTPTLAIDTAARTIKVDGTPVTLGARAFDVLAYLDAHRDRVVSKAELLEQVWGGLAVEEGNLSVQISALRKALGPKAIATVPGVGYKLATATATDAPKPIGPSVPDIPSIAVLPFANLTGLPEQDYLVDGIVADLVSTLSRLPGMFVIASSSSFAYKGKTVSLPDIGAELGVRYLLEGSIQAGGNRLRITSQLVEAETGRTLWTERFEGVTDDVFDLQDQIAARTASALEVNILFAESDRARAKPTDSMQAYDLALQAAPLVFRIQSEAELEAASALLDRALALDPDYAYAKALKVRAYMMGSASRAITYEAARAVLPLAYSQITGRNTDAFALANAGHYLAYLGGETELGYKSLKQAEALNPNSVMVRSSLGWVCNYSGRYGEAIGHFEACYRLNPLHPHAAHARSGHGYALIGMERYAEAIEMLEDALAEDPGFGSTTQALIVAYELGGRHEAAVALNQTYMQQTPQASLAYYLKNTPFTDPVFRDRYRAALDAAGLPEGGA
jgi:TolB-like protein